MTPTEIMKAEETGAALIKLFPGNSLGPGFVSAIKELFPDVLFIPTGGVKLEEVNLKAMVHQWCLCSRRRKHTDRPEEH